MTDRPLSHQEDRLAWELRGYMVTLREIVVAWPGGRIRGYVQYVAPTDAFTLIWDGLRETHIPVLIISSIRRPHYHEPLDGKPVERPQRHVIFVYPGQLQFDLDDGGSGRHPGGATAGSDRESG